MDEDKLVASAQRGNVQAFNQLVLSYQQIAYNVAYRILRDGDRAADATQDAFLRGYRALPQFRGGSFKAWILRIVTNCSYDQMRVRQRRPTSALDDLVDSDEHSRILEDKAESPETYVERREFDSVIADALELLPPDQRTVVVLSDVQGLSYEEISQATSVSLGTVKSRLSRARAKVRDYFREHKELLPSSFRLSDE